MYLGAEEIKKAQTSVKKALPPSPPPSPILERIRRRIEAQSTRAGLDRYVRNKEFTLIDRPWWFRLAGGAFALHHSLSQGKSVPHSLFCGATGVTFPITSTVVRMSR